MNQSIDTSSNVYLEQSEAEQLLPVLHQNLHDSSLASNANGSIISLLQRETIERKRTLKENVFYPPMVPNSTLTNCCPMDHGNSSLRESMRTLPSPDSQSSAVASPKGDPSLRVLHQAKWARVEDVIKSTAGSPHTNVIDDGEARRHGVVGTRNTNIENEGKQRFPQQQDLDQSRDGTTSRGGRCSCSKNKESQDPREQLQTTQRLLRHNKTKLIQVYDLCASEEAVRREVGQDHSSWDMAFPGTSALHMDPSGEFTRGMEKVKVGQQNIKKIDYVHMRFDREDKHLIDLLKTELSRAINMSVDLVFKNVSRSLFKSPRLQDSNNDSVLSSPPEQSSTEAVSMPWPSYSERAVLQIPEVQTEALSLVIQNPSLGHPSAVNQTLKRTRQFNHQPRCHFKHYNVLEEQQALEHFKYNSPHEILGSFPCRRAATGQSSLEMMEFSWNPIKVRPKINSNYMSHQGHLMAQNHVPLDSLRLPHIKMECRDIQSMVERNSFVPLNIQEGLTPSHLKKAKLMFFYTRYPSANVLKTFFPDVKFSRCITSQMIKWFSNFREFYYIQMEKFARQAIADGVANVKDLSVGRDSGLFRALNAHYNKANDFQVPDRFLGVVEVTLQEFYIAVSLSKDSDPSWKKSIYKVICKLDSDVPTGFKSSALSHC